MSLYFGGRKGTAGSSGAAGAPGADAPQYEGIWSGATAYAVDAIVSWDGSSYICTVAHTNQEPPNASYWDVLAAAGVDYTPLDYVTETDRVSDVVTYFGRAVFGTATSVAEWQVYKLIGVECIPLLADGNMNFDNVWDNRAGLSYS